MACAVDAASSFNGAEQQQQPPPAQQHWVQGQFSQWRDVGDA